MKSSIPFTAFTVLVLLLAAPASRAAITCSDAIKDLRPCMSYLQSGSGKPPSDCCNGAKALASAASTSADRKAACNCLKTVSAKINLKPTVAQALPGNCGITLGFTVGPNIDCSTVT